MRAKYAKKIVERRTDFLLSITLAYLLSPRTICDVVGTCLAQTKFLSRLTIQILSSAGQYSYHCVSYLELINNLKATSLISGSCQYYITHFLISNALDLKLTKDLIKL